MKYGDGKKKLRVVGQSDVFSSYVPDPKAEPIKLSQGLWDIPQIEMKCSYDFTDEDPNYNEDNWWYINEETKVVHILLSNQLRKRYVELMDRKIAGEELSKEELSAIDSCESIMTATAQTASNKAIMKYYELLKGKDTVPTSDDADTPKKEYRTKAKAGDVVDMPTNYAIITQPSYQNAMGLFQAGNAYMQPLASSDGLEYKKGKLYFKGLPASEAELKEYYTDEVPDTIDLPLLRVFYSIILNTFLNNLKEEKQQSPTLNVYLPDLFSFVGRNTVSRNDVTSLIDNIISYHTLMGIIDGDILPVLVYLGEDQKKNTISFSSPYMNRVIEKIYNVSIRTDKNGKPKLKKNGEPQTLPVYSYLIKPTIKSERNLKAVEIVHIITTLIEQAGDNEPHISAKTIVERNMQLRYSLQNASPADKNKMLKRAFTKAWELLRTQTDLEKTYKDIELPDPKDPKNIPTASQLDKMVFTFKHNGKHKTTD